VYVFYTFVMRATCLAYLTVVEQTLLFYPRYEISLPTHYIIRLRFNYIPEKRVTIKNNIFIVIN